MKKTFVYLGFGSNLGNRVENIKQAIQMLIEEDKLMFTCLSSFYDNPPLGGLTQPHFINAVGLFVTNFSPFELLERIHLIESKLGRRKVRKHWAPLPIDIDILIYGSIKIDRDDLVIPHKEIKNRSFVLLPLLDIKKDITIPGLGKASDLVKFLKLDDCKKIVNI